MKDLSLPPVAVNDPIPPKRLTMEEYRDWVIAVYQNLPGKEEMIRQRLTDRLKVPFSFIHSSKHAASK